MQRAALARNLLIFFAGLAAAGLILAVLNQPFDQLATAGSGIATSSEAKQGQGYVTAFWDALPFIIVFLSLAQLLGAAASERRLPGQ